ncbi:MAG: hypothetical protein ACRETX_13825, partial [Steroidobacteraceae bacterium]
MERRYDLKLESTVTARGETILSYKLTADWLVAGVEGRGTELLVRSQLERPTLQSSTARADEASKLRTFEQTLGLPHFFALDAEGAVSETRMHRSMPTFVQSSIRWIVAATQFVAAKLDAPSWEREEFDASGRYRARYEIVSPGHFRKQKLEYSTPPAAGASPAFQLGQVTEVLESRSSFSLGTHREITSLDVVERTRVPGNGPLPEMTSSTKLTLRLKNTGTAAVRVAAKSSELEQTVASKLSDPPAKSARRADVDQSKIAGRSLSQMLSSHHAASGDDRDAVTKRAREYVGVAALLRQDDKARADAVARIERGDKDASLLIDALGDAGDPASQKALIGLIDKARLDDKQERGALISLSLVDEPTDTAISALRERLDDPELGTQASYGLGA